jgi:hypothetical protein
MIMQIFLTLSLLAYVVYAQTQRHNAYMVSEITSIGALAGLVLVWWPDMSNRVAAFVGIGRGADLIFYCFILVGMVVSFNVHLRIKANNALITELARHIAIAGARIPSAQRDAQPLKAVDE